MEFPNSGNKKYMFGKENEIIPQLYNIEFPPIYRWGRTCTRCILQKRDDLACPKSIARSCLSYLHLQCESIFSLWMVYLVLSRYHVYYVIEAELLIFSIVICCYAYIFLLTVHACVNTRITKDIVLQKI